MIASNCGCVFLLSRFFYSVMFLKEKKKTEHLVPEQLKIYELEKRALPLEGYAVK